MRSRLAQTLFLTAVALIVAFVVIPSPLGPHPRTTGVATQSHEPLGPSAGETVPVAVPDLPNTGEESAPQVQASEHLTVESLQSDDSRQQSSSAPSKVLQHVQAILDPSDTTFERLYCPDTIGRRYEGLKTAGGGKPKYFFALDLYEVEKLLPRLMGSIVQAVRYLGPENCAVSIVEGRSDDATIDILLVLQAELRKMGVTFFLTQDNVDPHGEGVDRINALAELRNLAIRPLIKNPNEFSDSAIVVFINDIAVCAEDILELLYQHNYQSAVMTCAMDWIHDGDAFYDVWISRTIHSGNLFFNVPEDADWKYKENLFFDDPPTKKKFKGLQPFEVYACWGGMVTLDPTPFIAEKIAFRRSAEDECYMGEPTLLGKDLWRLGVGRIATIPTVNVGYTNEETTKIKKRRGYVSEHVDVQQPPENAQAELIEWSSKPPPMIKCEGVLWDDPHWVPPV